MRAFYGSASVLHRTATIARDEHPVSDGVVLGRRNSAGTRHRSTPRDPVTFVARIFSRALTRVIVASDEHIDYVALAAAAVTIGWAQAEWILQVDDIVVGIHIEIFASPKAE